MQIREKGGRFIFVKTVYNPAKRRGESVQLGSASIEDFTVDMREGYALSDDEQVQWANFKDEQRSFRWRDGHRSALINGPATIAAITTAVGYGSLIGLGGTPLNEDVANGLWEAMAELQKALKKAGHKRPKKSTTVEGGEGAE